MPSNQRVRSTRTRRQAQPFAQARRFPLFLSAILDSTAPWNVLMKVISIAALCMFNMLTCAVAADQYDAEVTRESLEITATREPESVEKVPASITIVSGEELRLRGAHDLRSALLLVSGVEGTPGGDSGPAGTVPGLWGRSEEHTS